MKVLVKALVEETDYGLKLELVAGADGLERELDNSRVQKPGLALTGFTESVRPKRVQVLGKTEHRYLESLPPEGRRAAIDGLFSTEMGCLIITTDLQADPSIVEAGDRRNIPVFRTPLPSSLLIRRVERFLDWLLSPETSRHAVLLDVFGVGVMLVGPSSIGKSECALDLILRGHRLVADDVVVIRRQGEQLIGTGSALTRHHMEVRGLGIINVKDLFGAASVREQKRIELVVEMSDWSAGEEFDRLGIDDECREILDLRVAFVRLPIRPGRNVASIIEVAARNHLLKVQGHHSAREFKETLERRLEATARDVPAPEAE